MPDTSLEIPVQFVGGSSEEPPLQTVVQGPMCVF